MTQQPSGSRLPHDGGAALPDPTANGDVDAPLTTRERAQFKLEYRKLWIPLLGVLGAAAISGLIVLFQGGGSAPAVADAPLSITIDQVPPVSRAGANFTGTVTGKTPDQVVWLFDKQLTGPDGSFAKDGVVLVSVGPCEVESTHWTCANARLGNPGPADDGTYQVWASVLNHKDAQMVGQHIGGFVEGDAPPGDKMVALDHPIKRGA